MSCCAFASISPAILASRSCDSRSSSASNFASRVSMRSFMLVTLPSFVLFLAAISRSISTRRCLCHSVMFFCLLFVFDFCTLLVTLSRSAATFAGGCFAFERVRFSSFTPVLLDGVDGGEGVVLRVGLAVPLVQDHGGADHLHEPEAVFDQLLVVPARFFGQSHDEVVESLDVLGIVV